MRQAPFAPAHRGELRAPRSGEPCGRTMRNVEPLPVRAVDLHAPVVGPHDVLDDGEAQAAALALAREAVVDAVELLEDAPVLDARDALAVVASPRWRCPAGATEPRSVTTGGRAAVLDARWRAGSRARRPSRARSTSTGGRSGVDLGSRSSTSGCRWRSGANALSASSTTARDGLVAQLEQLAPGLHAPPVEQALDAPGEPLGLASERRRGTCPAWPGRRARAPCVSAKRRMLGERRAELVAHLRDEVGLQLAQVGLAPQEHEHEHDARDGDQHEAHRERRRRGR